ncbi:hypothetical protein AGMMS49546_11810 [Spirochaetia bacterium]|nr:hypothetical protein AGMMS49546_11810 [Spirochaetia bacterium]
MPWRLIGIILLFAVFLIFIGLNLDNRCDIRYWFTQNAKIADVPVFITAFASFVLGMLLTIPFIISIRLKKKPKGEYTESPRLKGKKKKDEPSDVEEILPGGGGPYGIN